MHLPTPVTDPTQNIFLNLHYYAENMNHEHISGISRVRTVMKNLEKSWNFKTAFSRPGKVLEK